MEIAAPTLQLRTMRNTLRDTPTLELIHTIGLRFDGVRDGRIYWSDGEHTCSAELGDANQAAAKVLNYLHMHPDCEHDEAYAQFCNAQITGQVDESIYPPAVESQP